MNTLFFKFLTCKDSTCSDVITPKIALKGLLFHVRVHCSGSKAQMSVNY